MTADIPEISVIMPVFNGEKYLVPAIDSILSQSFRNFEFLIHDDGSTDATAEILKDYERRDPRIVLSYGKNLGVTEALNGLVRRARAPYLARFDADDISVLDRLERQLAYITDHPEIGVLGCWSIIIDEAGRRLVPNHMPLTHAEIDDRNLRGLCSLCHPAVLMRRDLVLKLGGYNVLYEAAQDLDLWLRMAEITQIENMPYLGVHYRMHKDSVSDRKQEAQASAARGICAEARSRRNVEAPFDYFPWRSSDNKDEQDKLHLRYAWQAWKYGYHEGWRHYALHSVKSTPLNPEAWKVLLAGLRRPPARQEIR